MAVYEMQSDFQTEVLERSKTRPVLVDFWAAWCGPCRIIGPVLEKLAREAEGKWDLVKLDTEAHQDVAAMFNIHSIPTVILFEGGKPVGAFTGALPEGQVRKWLEEHMSTPATGPLQAAEQALQEGNPDEARRQLLKALAVDPDNGKIRLMLARVRFPEDADAVREILEAVPEDDPAWPKAESLLRLADLVSWAEKNGNAPRRVTGDPALVERYHQAAAAVAKEQYEEALEQWLAVASQDRKLDDDGARKAMLALFDYLGDEHPLTQEYRRRLASVLY